MLNQAALGKTEELEAEKVPTLWAKDYHTLAGVVGLKNKIAFLALFCRFALMRTESRGGHYRVDYPERDDENWLRWVICQRTTEGTEVWTEPVHFDKYPLKPAADTEEIDTC